MTSDPTHWFLLSSDGEISVRINDGMRLGESELGELELVPLPEDVRVTLHSYSEGVQVVAAEGFALQADSDAQDLDMEAGELLGSALLGHGDRLDLLASTAVVSNDFSSSYRTLGKVMREGVRYAVVAADHDPVLPEQDRVETNPGDSESAGAVAGELHPPMLDEGVDTVSESATVVQDLSDGDEPLDSGAEDRLDEPKEPPEDDGVQATTAEDEGVPTVVERAFGRRATVGSGDSSVESGDVTTALAAANDSAVVEAIVAEPLESTDMASGGERRVGKVLAIGLLLVVGSLVLIAWLLGSGAEEELRLDTQSTPPAVVGPIDAQAREPAQRQHSVTGRGAGITNQPGVSAAQAVEQDRQGSDSEPDTADEASRTGPEAEETAAAPAAEVNRIDQLSVGELERQRVAELLAEAEAFYDETIWTRGVDGSAAQRYIEVLSIDPGNAEALAGLARLRRGIANMRDAESRDSSMRRLERMLQAVEAAQAASSTARDEADAAVSEPADDQALSAGVASTDKLLSRASDRLELGFLTQPFEDSALDLAQRALALDPGNEQAQAIIDRIADRLVVVAQELAVYERPSDATELLREILSFAPAHARARRLAAELGDNPS